MKRIAFLLTSTAAALALSACGQKEATPQAAATNAPVTAQCGKVKVANMTWQSAEVLAHVDQIILSQG